jgi:hypothetical protein
MSNPTKTTEQKRATAVCELAKDFISAAVLAQGPLPTTALPADVSAYFDRACNMAFSLAGLYRRKAIELVESAKQMDLKSEQDAV